MATDTSAGPDRRDPPAHILSHPRTCARPPPAQPDGRGGPLGCVRGTAHARRDFRPACKWAPSMPALTSPRPATSNPEGHRRPNQRLTDPLDHNRAPFPSADATTPPPMRLRAGRICRGHAAHVKPFVSATRSRGRDSYDEWPSPESKCLARVALHGAAFRILILAGGPQRRLAAGEPWLSCCILPGIAPVESPMGPNALPPCVQESEHDKRQGCPPTQRVRNGNQSLWSRAKVPEPQWMNGDILNRSALERCEGGQGWSRSDRRDCRSYFVGCRFHPSGILHPG
jgi:hypothetical protein